jgi:PAS domain S-box-containing protein
MAVAGPVTAGQKGPAMSQTDPLSGRPEDPGANAQRFRRLEEENALLRRRLEEAEAEAARIRAAAAEQTPIPMFTKNLQGRYTWCNAAFESQAGQRREHFVGKTVRDILPLEAAEFHETMDREMFAHPSPQAFEYVFRPDKADNRNGLFVRTPLLDGGGKLTGLVCAILDLTERKAVEETLRLSEQRLELILRHSNDGINIAETDSELKWRKLVICNDRFVQMSGRSREELMAAGNLNQFIRAYADQAIHEENLRKLQDGTPITGEASWIRPDGKENYYEWTGASTRMGDRFFLIGIDRDMTERVLAERALRESEGKYRTLVEAAGETVSVFDESGTYRYINEVGAARRGLTPDEIIGKTFWDIYAKEVADQRAKLVRDVIRTGQPFEGEVLTVFGGREQWDRVSLRLLPGALGSAPRVLGVDHDITGRKRAELALQEREESERYLRTQLTLLHQVTNELSTAATFDELCRQAIVLGRSRLGFDRLGLWFAGKDPDYLVGSYGTDESGYLRDEHAGQAWLSPGTVIAEVMNSRKPMVLRDDSPLFDHGRQVVGRGTHAAASLWDGEAIIGCLTTDNLLKNKPLSDGECEVLKLYAAALGHLSSRKHAEEAVREAHRQLVNAREEERKRLAAELHDSLGQELIGIDLKMQALMPDLQARLDPKHSQELDKIFHRFREAIANVRSISHNLFPPLLATVGLAAALREMASRISSSIPIKVDCASSLEKLRWPPDVEIALFRIAQEALHNAVRHSQASRIKLALEYKRGTAVLTIRDDGVGFDPHCGAVGLGLSTMTDRAKTIGGILVAGSRPGSTFIEARVPAQAARKNAGD